MISLFLSNRLSMPVMALITMAALAACATSPSTSSSGVLASAAAGANVEKLLLVDCRLPSRLIQHGMSSTYLIGGATVKTTAADCEIRGGKYIAFDRSNYATALRTLLPEAQGGDPIAQTYVGEIYEKGLGLPAPDYAQAAEWYRRAADRGYAQAQINLALLYEKGLGVSQNSVNALNLYRQASGLDKDELAFASELEAERQALRQEIALREQATASLRSRFQGSKQQLEAKNQRLNTLQQELDETRRRLQQQQSLPDESKDSAAVKLLETRLQELQAQLSKDALEKSSIQQELEREKALLKAQLRDVQSREEDLKRRVHGLEQQLEKRQEQLDANKQAQLRKARDHGEEMFDLVQAQSAQLEMQVAQL